METFGLPILRATVCSVRGMTPASAAYCLSRGTRSSRRGKRSGTVPPHQLRAPRELRENPIGLRVPGEHRTVHGRSGRYPCRSGPATACSVRSPPGSVLHGHPPILDMGRGPVPPRRPGLVGARPISGSGALDHGRSPPPRASRPALAGPRPPRRADVRVPQLRSALARYPRTVTRPARFLRSPIARRRTHLLRLRTADPRQQRNLRTPAVRGDQSHRALVRKDGVRRR